MKMNTYFNFFNLTIIMFKKIKKKSMESVQYIY